MLVECLPCRQRCSGNRRGFRESQGRRLARQAGGLHDGARRESPDNADASHYFIARLQCCDIAPHGDDGPFSINPGVKGNGSGIIARMAPLTIWGRPPRLRARLFQARCQVKDKCLPKRRLFASRSFSGMYRGPATAEPALQAPPVREIVPMWSPSSLLHLPLSLGTIAPCFAIFRLRSLIPRSTATKSLSTPRVIFYLHMTYIFKVARHS